MIQEHNQNIEKLIEMVKGVRTLITNEQKPKIYQIGRWAAIVSIRRATAIEAASRKIRVNSVHSGPVDNRMMRSIEEGSSAGNAEEVKK